MSEKLRQNKLNKNIQIKKQRINVQDGGIKKVKMFSSIRHKLLYEKSRNVFIVQRLRNSLACRPSISEQKITPRYENNVIITTSYLTEDVWIALY
jgi:hypothetical protein